MSNIPHSNASLYVGDLAPEVSEGHLFEVFKKSGALSSIRVCRDAITRRSLGYAYVNFHDPEHATKALDDVNAKNIKGRPCRVMWVQRDPTLRKSGLGNIFIKNLNPEITHKELYDTFAEYGPILSCKIATSSDGKSKGFAFVHFEKAESAAEAIKQANGKVMKQVDGKGLKEQQIYVGPFVPRKDRVTPNSKEVFTNVYIKNFPETWNKEKLEEVFKKFGEIDSACMPTNTDGKPKGYAFVNFKEHEAAKKAVEEMNDSKEYTTEDKKHHLYVARFQKKAERQNEIRKNYEEIRRKNYEKWRGTNLYIKNIEDSMDDKKLEEEFSVYGKINSAHIMRDQKTKNSRGFGFVCFSSADEAEKALQEMNGKMIGSKPLYVALAQRKEDRRHQLEMHHARKSRIPHMYPPSAMYYSGVPPSYTYPAPMMRGGRPGPGWPAGYSTGAYAGMPMPVSTTGRNSRPPRNVPSTPATVVSAPPAISAAAEKPIDTTADLDNLTEEQKRQSLGEKLFPLIQAIDEARAGKITGMLLERYKTTPEILLKLANDPAELKSKVEEAATVLQKHAVTANE